MEWRPIDFKTARVRARMSQAALAAQLGISQKQLSRFELGRVPLRQEKKQLAYQIIMETQLRQQDEEDVS